MVNSGDACTPGPSYGLFQVRRCRTGNRKVENHYSNPLIRARFANSNRPEVERHVFEFLCAGSGGPQCYTGKDLVTAHKGMNINEQELVAAIDDILEAMAKNGYDQAEKNEVVAILYSLKGDVVRL